MASFNSVEMDGLDDTPISYPMAADFGGRVRAQFASFTFASQTDPATITVARIPKGGRIVGFIMNNSVSFGATAEISIGVAGAVGRFRASATYTATGSALLSVVAASTIDGVEGIGEKFTDDTDIIITLTDSTADLPASGGFTFITLYTID